MRLWDIFEPTPFKGGIALVVAGLIILLDYVFGYCTEDSCFNGIYRLAGGDQYTYFFLANVMKGVLIMLLIYASFALVYSVVKMVHNR